MQIFDFTVAVGKFTEINANGRYIYYYAGSAGSEDKAITLREDTTGTNILLLPGQSFRIPDEQKTANRWIIGNYGGGTTIAGKLVIGSGALQDNRVTGSIDVIDGKKYKSLLGSSFVGGMYTPPLPPNSSDSPQGFGVWNPSSTKNVFISKITISSPVAQNISFGMFNSIARCSFAGFIRAKKLGSVNSIAQLYKSPINSNGAPDDYTEFGYTRLPVDTPVVFSFDEPIILINGKGFFVKQENFTGGNLFVTVEAYEENV